MKYCKLKKLAIALSLAAFITTGANAAISTDAKLQYNKGIDYYHLGQFEEAAACFREAVALDPNYIDAYYNLGSILEYLKQDEMALSVFKQIILRKPTDYEAVYKAAELTRKLGDPQKAKIYLSIIPQDSLIGQKAKQLSDKLDEEIASATVQQEEPQAAEDSANNSTIQAEQTALAQGNTPQTTQSSNGSVLANSAQPEITEQAPKNNQTEYASNEIFENIPSPTGVAVDNSGNIFVAGFSSNTIFKIGPDKNKIVYLKSSQIDGPIGIAIDANSNLYIANYNKNNVIKVDKNGVISELLTNVINPYCMFVKGNTLYVSSQGTNSILKYQLK